MLQETSLYLAYAAPLLQNLVFHNLSYEVDSFDFDKDVARVDSLASPLIDEIASDLDAFRLRGGKMIVTQGKLGTVQLLRESQKTWHSLGWTDPFNAPTWPIEHLKQLEKASRHGSVAEFFNLYMVPGKFHICHR